MCGSRKYPYPLQGRSLEIPREGVCQSQVFKGKYEAKLEIPGGLGGGGRVSNQKTSVGGMDIFWTTQ